MTKRQKEVMDFLKEYYHNNGVTPTMKEVSEYFEVSISTIQSHFKSLEIKGHLSKSPHHARGIKIENSPKKIIFKAELISKLQELENRILNLEQMSKQ